MPIATWVDDALAREFGGSPGQERNEVITNPVIRFVMDDFRPVPWAINIDLPPLTGPFRMLVHHSFDLHRDDAVRCWWPVSEG